MGEAHEGKGVRLMWRKFKQLIAVTACSFYNWLILCEKVLKGNYDGVRIVDEDETFII